MVIVAQLNPHVLTASYPVELMNMWGMRFAFRVCLLVEGTEQGVLVFVQVQAPAQTEPSVQKDQARLDSKRRRESKKEGAHAHLTGACAQTIQVSCSRNSQSYHWHGGGTQRGQGRLEGLAATGQRGTPTAAPVCCAGEGKLTGGQSACEERRSRPW